jgi:hypothetical protein
LGCKNEKDSSDHPCPFFHLILLHPLTLPLSPKEEREGVKGFSNTFG